MLPMSQMLPVLVHHTVTACARISPHDKASSPAPHYGAGFGIRSVLPVAMQVSTGTRAAREKRGGQLNSSAVKWFVKGLTNGLLRA
eukprot:9164781-Pyramimonas_sp.AAC.1